MLNARYFFDFYDLNCKLFHVTLVSGIKVDCFVKVFRAVDA
ncbi:MAG: hypothetical protein ACI8XV_002561 [Arenicella sp.]